MAFPYTFEENFELGEAGDFDAETDSDAKLDFPHYSEIARVPGIAMPFRGAYCMRIDLAGGTNDAYVQETGSFDMTAGTNDIYCRFMLWIDPNIVMANTNEFALMQFWSATSTVEGGVYLNFTTANGLRIGIGKDTSAASSFLPITTNEWHSVEVFFDPAGANGSTLDLWLDDAQATQLDTFTSADITSAVFGAIGIDAGTTAGTLLIDTVIADDARIFKPKQRFNDEMMVTKSGHICVGPGTLHNISLLSGAGTDNVVSVYDTDEADTNDGENLIARLTNTANNELVDPAGMPASFVRGCYVQLAGTDPRALAQIGLATGWGSDGAVRNYAHRR